MAKKPSISFYTSDFISQTMFLSFEDKGKLIMLYCLQHQHGHLSKEQMEQVCGNLSTGIMSFFQTDSEGKYYNEQIEQSMIERENFIKRQKEKVNKRWKKDTTVDTTVNTTEHTTVNTTVIPLEDEDEKEEEIENKGKKIVKEKGNLPVKVKKKSPQAIMGDYFKSIYKRHTGYEYLAKAKDYTLLAELIKEYGMEKVKQKIEWLEVGCKNRVFWFAKESGINSFTIGKLYSQWNEILPQYTAEQLKAQEEQKKEEERMKRVLAEVKRRKEEEAKWSSQ